MSLLQATGTVGRSAAVSWLKGASDVHHVRKLLGMDELSRQWHEWWESSFYTKETFERYYGSATESFVKIVFFLCNSFWGQKFVARK